MDAMEEFCGEGADGVLVGAMSNLDGELGSLFAASVLSHLCVAGTEV